MHVLLPWDCAKRQVSVMSREEAHLPLPSPTSCAMGPWSKVGVPLYHSPWFLWDAGSSNVVEPTLPGHKPPTPGTLDVIPLVPLVRSLDAWTFLQAGVPLE